MESRGRQVVVMVSNSQLDTSKNPPGYTFVSTTRTANATTTTQTYNPSTHDKDKCEQARKCYPTITTNTNARTCP
jgi:hypothetical protein